MNLSWGAERDIIYHPKSFCQIILSRKLRFFAKKQPNAQARGRRCVCVCMQAFLRIFWMATVVCRLRGRGACMGIMGTVRFMRGVWARLGIPRGFAVPLGGGAWGADLPQRYAGNVMATVVCRLRGRGACIRLIRLIRLIK